VNEARQLDAQRVRELWADPLLRASNMLDALFHRTLVLCEADGDCRFYNAVLEAICDAENRPRPDVMFAHTGGKHRLPTAVSAMMAAGIPVHVVADIDIRSGQQPLRGVWEGLGGAWADVAEGRRIVATAVETSVRRAGRAHVREQTLATLDADQSATIDETTAERLRSFLRSDGGWHHVKRQGMVAIPPGDARRAADELVDVLRARGLHVVPEGELEGFVRQLGGHGPAWVEEAWQLDLARDERAASARAFVRSLGLT
jgi:hypothetical protein